MIEVRKYYKTRDGRKVRIYALNNGKTDCTIHGAVLRGNSWNISSWGTSGNYRKSGLEDPWDIVSEWTNEVEFDFKLIPPWYKYLAKNINNTWRAYGKEPIILEIGYWSAGTTDNIQTLCIPEEFAPKWEGEWKESLTMNPYYKE